MYPARRLAAVSLAATLAIAMMACTAPATPSTADGDGGAGTTVEVTLQEWAVRPAQVTAPAGEVTFAVTNDGPADIHEFVVFRSDLDPASLPVDEHGTVDEAGEGVELIDEIEDIAFGDSAEVTVDLEAGNYVLICNIYSEDEDEAHYTMGMRTAFTVTD